MHPIALVLPAFMALAALAPSTAPTKAITVLFQGPGHQLAACRCLAITFPKGNTSISAGGVITVSVSIENIVSTHGEHTWPDTNCVDKNCEGTADAVFSFHSAASSSGNGYWIGSRFFVPGQTFTVPLQTSCGCGERDESLVSVQDMDGPSGTPGTTLMTAGIKLDCGM
jgi:hypothetical protein